MNFKAKRTRSLASRARAWLHATVGGARSAGARGGFYDWVRACCRAAARPCADVSSGHTGCRTTRPAADVYSFGVILTEIFMAEAPYSDRAAEIEAPGFRAAIVAGTMRPTMKKDNVPGDICDLATRCMLGDPTKRPAFRAIMLELESSVSRLSGGV